MKQVNYVFLILFSILFLFVSISGAYAGSLGGPWAGEFPTDEPHAEHDYPFTVTADSLVSLTVTGAPTLKSQYASIQILDVSEKKIAEKSFFSGLPVTVSKPLAPGNYIARIMKNLSTIYGSYSIDDGAIPTNPASDEVEPNDSSATATPLATMDFSGSIGHWRMYDDVDLKDYFIFTVTRDGTLTLDTTYTETLKSYSAYQYVRDSSDRTMFSRSLSSDSLTVRMTAYLTPGDYNFRMFLALSNLWGSYVVDASFSPAQPHASSETETNDTLSTADTVDTPTVYGSYGYKRDGGSATESSDYRDCFTVAKPTPGDVTLTSTVDDSLVGFYSGIRLYDSGQNDIGYYYFSAAERTRTWEDMPAGRYYFCLWRTRSDYWGGYKIETVGLAPPQPPAEPGGWSMILPYILRD